MQQTEKPSAFYTLMAGGFAGTFSWLVSFPVDVVKSRLQTDGMDGKLKYTGAVDCVKKSYQAEGMNFFTRGLTSTLLRAFPMNAVCFLVVSYVMNFFQKNPVEVTVGQPETLAISYQPSFVMRVFNQAQKDLNHKPFHYMVFLDGFHEASCHTEMMELSDELREQRANTTYFYQMNNEPVMDQLSDDELKTPLK